MNKKGQLTIFIIIAIILISSVILYFSYRENLNQNIYPAHVENVKIFTETCIENTAQDALFFTGQSSGYFEIPELSNNGLAYYYYNNKNYMPSKQKIADEISKYIDFSLSFCTGNFTEFSNLEVKQRNSTTQIMIKDEQIIVNVKYPLTITKNNATYNLENFNNIKINTRLGIIHNAIKEIIQQQIKYKQQICLSCITDISQKYDLKIDITNLADNKILVIIKDEYSKINNMPLEFKFIMKY